MATLYPTLNGKMVKREDCAAIIDTAMTDTGYWAEGRNIVVNGEEAEIESIAIRPHRREGIPFPNGDPRNDWQTITPQRIASTLADIMASNKAPTWLRVRLVEMVDQGDLAGADAEEADCILQLCMFSEIVFG